MLRAIIASFRQPYLDLSITDRDGQRIRIVERPGLWMPDTDLAQLAEQLRYIAGRALPQQNLNYGDFSGSKAAFDRTIVTLISARGGTPIAFNALAVMDADIAPEPVEVLHLGLVMVDPDARSRSLSWALYGLTCFLIFLRGKMRPRWVSSVTHVPAVVGMVAETFSEVWPAPDARPRRLGHLFLGRSIMTDHRVVFGVGPEAGFDEDRFVITDAYRGGSEGLKKRFADAPPHRNPIYGEFCKDRLDYDRGDDFLQIGLIDLAAMRRFLQAEVPKGMVFRLTVTGAMLALQQLLLPVLYWFDSDKPWGLLRPQDRGRG